MNPNSKCCEKYNKVMLNNDERELRMQIDIEVKSNNSQCKHSKMKKITTIISAQNNLERSLIS